MKTTVARIYGLVEVLNPEAIWRSRMAMEASRYANKIKKSAAIGKRSYAFQSAHEKASTAHGIAAEAHVNALRNPKGVSNSEAIRHANLWKFHNAAALHHRSVSAKFSGPSYHPSIKKFARMYGTA